MRQQEDKQTGKKRSKKLRWISMAVGFVLLAVGGLTVVNLAAGRADGADADATVEDPEAEGTEEDAEEKAPVPVEVVEIASGDVSAYITATANLVAENQVIVLAQVEGLVATLKVEEGDYVRKGQHLATLLRDDEEIRLRKSKLRESNAHMAFERAEDLREKELISQEEYDTLKVDFEIARQESAEAQWAIDQTTIKAPFSGRLTRRIIQLGQHVRPGDELFQVTDFDPLIARIYLPERDVLGLNEGRKVRMSLNADDSVVFEGKVRWISPIVDTATGTVKLTLEAAASRPEIRPGSFITIDIVRETRADALLVPRESVIRELQKAHVFVTQGDVATKRAVKLGLEEGEFIEAVEGLQKGEKVVVAGQGGLKDGSPVKILGDEVAEDEEVVDKAPIAG